MLFAGTTEGRRICEFLAVKKCITHVYVTTEYGKDLLPEQNNVHIHVGKMDEGQMSDEISVILPDIVIDATHPYATQVTHNIKEACDSRNIFYVRVLREENTVEAGNNADNIIYTETMKDAVRLLNDDRFIHKNVLMTTGSKNIPEYVHIKDFKDRLYLRLLPNPQMMESAIQAGIMPAHLIGMQGPFSQELNVALIKQSGIGVLVTKQSGKSGGGSLSGMAAMLGIGGMSLGSEADALNVSLFPDIVASTPFILELFNAHVTTLDGEVDTTFVAYLDEQKAPWWGAVMGLPGAAIGGVKSLFSDKEEEEGNRLDPFHLTEDQAKKVEAMRKAITADVDKKTGITTVTVTLQDPMVTAAITDTVVVKLQEYITAYRVSKAQQDCAYLEQLYKERQQEYYVAQQNYANYMDANKGVVLQSALTERERLQNDMNLAYQVYSQVATQLQVARAKVQEAKPVFAVVEPASVPLLPSGTSKKVILVGFIFLAVAGASAWILFGREFFENLKAGLNAPQEGMEKK